MVGSVNFLTVRIEMLGQRCVYAIWLQWGVLARHILVPYRQKRKRYNVISIGCVCVFADTGWNHVPPKLPNNHSIIKNKRNHFFSLWFWSLKIKLAVQQIILNKTAVVDVGDDVLNVHSWCHIIYKLIKYGELHEATY